MSIFKTDTIMENTIDIHLGNMIEKELRRHGKSVYWLASSVNLERSGIYKLFRRKNISVQLLLKISVALQHDFFEDISELLKVRQLEEDSLNNTDSRHLMP